MPNNNLPSAQVRRPVMRRNAAFGQLQEGAHSSSGEVFSASHYDTYKILTGILTYKYFSVPLNQAGKTLADTNNLLAGVFPSSFRLTADMIKMIFRMPAVGGVTQSILDDIYNMFFNTTIQITMPGKDNLGLFTLSEIFGASMNVGYDAATLASGPQAIVSGKFRLNIPIVIAANTAYSVDLVHHVAPPATLYVTDYEAQLKFIFSGTMERLS